MGASISWSRTSWIWYPSSRRSDSRTSAFSIELEATTYTSAPTAAAITRAIINGVTSHLDLEDLAQPDEADEGHDAARDDGHDPERLLEQHAHVVGLDQVEHTGEHDREQPEDPPREASFCRQRPDLEAQPLPLGHRVRHGVEQLGQVATDLALDADRHDRPHEVDTGHPLRRFFERVLDRTAEA